MSDLFWGGVIGTSVLAVVGYLHWRYFDRIWDIFTLILVLSSIPMTLLFGFVAISQAVKGEIGMAVMSGCLSILMIVGGVVIGVVRYAERAKR